MPDLDQQIRAQLDGWAPPAGRPPLQFVEVVDQAVTDPEYAEEWQQRWDGIMATAEGMSLPVLAVPPRFYPGFEQMRAALTAVLDVTDPDREGYPDCDCSTCVHKRVTGAIARALGIEAVG